MITNENKEQCQEDSHGFSSFTRPSSARAILHITEVYWVALLTLCKVSCDNRPISLVMRFCPLPRRPGKVCNINKPAPSSGRKKPFHSCCYECKHHRLARHKLRFGTRISKRVPLPINVCTVTSPPRARADSRTACNPNPRPDNSVVVSLRENSGVKSSSRISASDNALRSPRDREAAVCARRAQCTCRRQP
jgi:hypothetical protein